MVITNVLGNYDPIFYAQEALIQLHKALGMAGRKSGIAGVRPVAAAAAGADRRFLSGPWPP